GRNGRGDDDDRGTPSSPGAGHARPVRRAGVRLVKTSAAHSPPSWGSMVVLGCVFAVGVAAGSFGWQARERAVEEATAAAEAELVAGPVTVESWPDGREAA